MNKTLFLTLALLTLITTSSEQENEHCYENSVEAVGIIVGSKNEVLSYNDCRVACASNEICECFSFYELSKQCNLFKECSKDWKLHAPHVVSGMKDCGEKTFCDLPGFCTGNLIETFSHESEYECLRECRRDKNCQYYAYNKKTKLCATELDCFSFDHSCSVCTSGERSCKVSKTKSREEL